MDKLIITDEYDCRVASFIKQQIATKTEREIIDLVRESFDYQHSNVYITDMVYHAA